jgi:hypothetical protein
MIQHEPYAAVIRAFMSSPSFEKNTRSTRKSWGNELALAERHIGHISNREIRPSIVQAFLDGLADRPGKQKVALCALKQVDKWAMVRDKLPTPATYGCEVVGCDDGRIPWTDEQVALGEQHAGDGFSRVITLAANTGQRLSDFVRMCWNDIETFEGRTGITVRGGQKKTGRSQWVPMTHELATAMATWERRPGPILLTPAGAPWNATSISTRWARERKANPALAPLRAVEFEGMTKDLTLHGLRGTACVRLLRAGATTRQIADMVGMSEATVKKYTRFTSQRQNAIAAVHHIDRTDGFNRLQRNFKPT